MAVLPLVLWPDARLGTPCAPIERITEEVRRLARDMLETMYAASGRGLAAPQVGAMLRLFVMDADWKAGPPRPSVFVNPQILWTGSERASGPEGCLSIPGVTAQIARPTAIRLGWTCLEGKAHEADLAGFEAICAQHEADHLDGRVTFDHLTRDARAELEAAYLGANR